jgi:DNA-binding CsgD family transcriptional regulator
VTDILNQLPFAIAWKDEKSIYLGCNQFAANIINLKFMEKIVGLTDETLPCASCEYADIFTAQDQEVLLKKEARTFFDIHPYGEGNLLPFVKLKKPYLKNHKMLGSICLAFPLQSTLSWMQVVFQHDQRFQPFSKKPCSYQITNKDIIHKRLTSKELEILFYLIRGYTAKEISLQLKRSIRTIETHIRNLKYSLNCMKRSELIEYAISQGYLAIIPLKVAQQFNQQLTLWSSNFLPMELPN